MAYVCLRCGPLEDIVSAHSETLKCTQNFEADNMFKYFPALGNQVRCDISCELSASQMKCQVIL